MKPKSCSHSYHQNFSRYVKFVKIGEFYKVQNRHSIEFDALKLWNVLSGAFVTDVPVVVLQAVLEIHDEVAAQIQNCHDEVEYIDGVSSIEEEDEEDGLNGDEYDAKSRLSSLPEDGEEKEGGGGDGGEGGEEEEEEVKVDTFRVIGVRRLAGQCLVRQLIRLELKVHYNV